MTPKGSEILKYYTIIFRVIETEQQRKKHDEKKDKSSLFLSQTHTEK